MKNMKFKGTIIAIVVIIIMVLVSKFVYKDDFKGDVVYYEPTEPTYEFYENTHLGVAPTEEPTEIPTK